MRAGDREGRRLIWAVGGLTALAAALRFAELDGQSLWYDETTTAHVLRPGLWDTLEHVRGREATPPLYYLVSWLWTRLAGEGEIALRAPSAVFGVLTVPATYVAGVRLAGRRTGLAAAALVATSPYLIWYSQEARAYSLAMLLSALSLVFLAGAAGADRPRRDLVLWAVTCSLLVATHYYTAVLVVAEAAWLLAKRGAGRRTLAAMATPLVAALVLAPLAIAQRADDRTEWIADLPLGERLEETLRLFAGGPPYSSSATGWAIAAGALAVAALVCLLWRGRGYDRSGGIAALALVGGGVAAALAFALAGLDYVLDRNLLVLWIPLAVAVAAGVASAPRVGAAGVLLLCGAFLASQVGIARDESQDRPDWQTAVRDLGHSREPRAVALSPGYSETPLLYYGLPVRIDVSGTSIDTREVAVIGESVDAAARAPGRRIGPFRVVARERRHFVTTAILRAEEPAEVELGPVPDDRFGGPDFALVLDPGTAEAD